MSNLGINLLEVDGKATPSIQGAPTSVAGFIVRSERGVPGVVRQITSFAEFRDFFGGFTATAYGAYAVRGFYDNGGGLAYAVRVVATATGATLPVAASKPFNDVDGVAAFTIKAGYRGKLDPGGWGSSLSIRIVADNAGTTEPLDDMFTLLVERNGATLETWEKLKIGGAGAQDPKRLNDEVSGSKYVVLQLGTSTKNPIATVDTAGKAVSVPLEGGADDDLDTDSDAKREEKATALKKVLDDQLLDSTEIQLLTCPETKEKTFVDAALSYCSGREDCMFVGHTPEAFDADDAKTYGQQYRANKVYGALYFPFIRVADPLGGFKWIPPTGHILGVYARTERERGIWKAPAGSAAHLNNALDLKFQINDIKHTDLVKNGSVNAVRFIAGQGIVIDSSRTLSTNTLWLYVNVRLLFNFVKSSLKNGLRFVVQEPNDPTLWNKVKYNSVTPFLMGLWRRGAFGPGAPEKVFSVKVDAENNPPENIQQGIFNVEVYFYPSRPAETIIITVGQQDGGATAGER